MNQGGFDLEYGSEFLSKFSHNTLTCFFRLFFNFLPVLKSSWAQAARKQRDDYYV